jgi:2-desacetyl-2-hydroxyethyl bacteriochlorophyllide A dehydrogenase
MTRTSLLFQKPHEITCCREPVPRIGPGEVLVQTTCSAISPGTEMLAYRGQIPEGINLDETIRVLSGKPIYPFKYGYSSVGRVIETGPGVDAEWLERRVFAFHPHESHYAAQPQDLIRLPEDMDPSEALFLPNMETALNFVLDGRPMLGECVVVFGQGVVGLLTTSILAAMPLGSLVTLDLYPLRRKLSSEIGAHAALDSWSHQIGDQLVDLFSSGCTDGAPDLIYEVSGNPEALDQAIGVAGLETRIVVGSWYGTKPVRLNLGAGFHRHRIRLISSQVSTLASDYAARWTKSRRIALAWNLIRRIKPSRFITHRFSIHEAAQAYAMLDQHPEDSIQVIFEYDEWR